MERVKGLEGMRGIAAFGVYTHHFLLIFYPAFYFGEHNWINHILNPDLAVSWFFVHSGFVLAYKGNFLEGKDYFKSLGDQALRRYLRLLPPVLLSILFSYVIIKFHLNFNNPYGKIVESKWLAGYLNFEADFLGALKQAFWGTYFFFKSSSTYNPSLWTIGYELISSYILFGILALFGFWRKSFWPLLLLGLIIPPWKGLMCFVLGASLTRLPAHKLNLFLWTLITAVGFYLSDLSGQYGSRFQSLSAAIIMYSLLQAPKIRDFLATKLIHGLGQISYSLYVLHFILLASLTSYLGMIWEAHHSTMVATAIYLITTSLLIMLSYLAWKFVDVPGINLAKKFSGLFLMNKPASGSCTYDKKTI